MYIPVSLRLWISPGSRGKQILDTQHQYLLTIHGISEQKQKTGLIYFILCSRNLIFVIHNINSILMFLNRNNAMAGLNQALAKEEAQFGLNCFPGSGIIFQYYVP